MQHNFEDYETRKTKTKLMKPNNCGRRREKREGGQKPTNLQSKVSSKV